MRESRSEAQPSPGPPEIDVARQAFHEAFASSCTVPLKPDAQAKLREIFELTLGHSIPKYPGIF